MFPGFIGCIICILPSWQNWHSDIEDIQRNCPNFKAVTLCQPNVAEIVTTNLVTWMNGLDNVIFPVISAFRGRHPFARNIRQTMDNRKINFINLVFPWTLFFNHCARNWILRRPHGGLECRREIVLIYNGKIVKIKEIKILYMNIIFDDQANTLLSLQGILKQKIIITYVIQIGKNSKRKHYFF